MRELGFQSSLMVRLAFLMLASLSASNGIFPAKSSQEAESSLPGADVILDRYIKITGGKTAYKDLHNTESRGTFQIMGSPLRGKYTAYEAEPNKTHTIFEFDGGEKNEQGSLGNVVWESSSKDGPRVIEGAEKVVALREATFNSMLNWRSLYRKAECVGTETVGDRSCYKVVLHPPTGKPLTQYFDMESGLLLKSFILLYGSTGEIRSENLYDDYRIENAGVLFPHMLIHRIMNEEEMVILLESVRCNVEIAWRHFDLPTGVKALTLKKPPSQSSPKRKS